MWTSNLNIIIKRKIYNFVISGRILKPQIVLDSFAFYNAEIL